MTGFCLLMKNIQLSLKEIEMSAITFGSAFQPTQQSSRPPHSPRTVQFGLMRVRERDSRGIGKITASGTQRLQVAFADILHGKIPGGWGRDIKFWNFASEFYPLVMDKYPRIILGPRQVQQEFFVDIEKNFEGEKWRDIDEYCSKHGKALAIVLEVVGPKKFVDILKDRQLKQFVEVADGIMANAESVNPDFVCDLLANVSSVCQAADLKATLGIFQQVEKLLQETIKLKTLVWA